MAKLQLKKGSTNVTLGIRIKDSSATDGEGLSGLAFNSSGLTCYYWRLGASATIVNLATQTVTGAHTDGGFVEIHATNMVGHYRLDLPDAVCASGVDFVTLQLRGATNMAPLDIEIQLTDLDPNDGVRAGLTALPNAAADAAGGLPISDAGALDLDLYLKSGVTLSGTASAGSATAITLAGGVATDNYYNGALVVLTGGTGAGQARTILDYVGSTTVATITRDWATAPDATTTFVVIGADVPAILEAGTAQAGAANSITLDAGASAISETYTNNFIMITGGTGIGQTRLIGAYNGATLVATVTPAWTTNPDATSVYQILPAARVDVGGWLGNLVTGDGDWAQLQSDVTATLTDTAEIGAAGAGLTDLGGMSTGMKAEVNAEAKDVIATDTIAELSGVPGATPTLEDAIMFLYMKIRNKETTTASAGTIANDAGTTIASTALSDDGATFTKGEYS